MAVKNHTWFQSFNDNFYPLPVSQMYKRPKNGHFGPKNGHFRFQNGHFGPKNGHFGFENGHRSFQKYFHLIIWNHPFWYII